MQTFNVKPVLAGGTLNHWCPFINESANAVDGDELAAFWFRLALLDLDQNIDMLQKTTVTCTTLTLDINALDFSGSFTRLRNVSHQLLGMLRQTSM